MCRCPCRSVRANSHAVGFPCRESCFSGVGHNPQSFPCVWGAGDARSQHAPLSIVPQRGQVYEDTFNSSMNEHWTVLHEDVRWSYFANDASKLRPESGARSVDARAFACARDVLAREAPADDVDVSPPGLAIEASDVIPDGEGREQSVPLTVQEHLPAVGINLDSADGAPAQQEPAQDATACPAKSANSRTRSPIPAGLALERR